MGRPKALKNKDLVPSIDIKNSKSNKKINFDDDQDVLESNQEIQLPEIQQINDENSDNEPEEVKADSLAIMKLKEELEKTSSIHKKIQKKRKVRQEKESGEELLEESVLESIVHSEGDDTKNYQKKQKLTLEVTKSFDKTQDNPNKIKIGNFNVTYLAKQDEYEKIKDFQLSKEPLQFNENKFSHVSRTKFSNFSSQRKIIPSKSFLQGRK